METWKEKDSSKPNRKMSRFDSGGKWKVCVELKALTGFFFPNLHLCTIKRGALQGKSACGIALSIFIARRASKNILRNV